jgi:hypothetical protein
MNYVDLFCGQHMAARTYKATPGRDFIGAEPHGRKVLLRLAERTEMIEEVGGSSFHIMTVGQSV